MASFMKRFFGIVITCASLLAGCDASQRSALNEDQKSDESIDRLWHDGKLAHQKISGGFNLGDCATNSQGQPRLSILNGRLNVFSDETNEAERLTRVTISCSWSKADVNELTDAGWLEQYTDIINDGRGVYGIAAYARIAPGTQMSFYGDDKVARSRSLRSISFNLAVQGSYSDEFTLAGRKPRSIPVTLTFAFPEAMKLVTLSDLKVAVKQRISFPKE